MRKSLGEQVRTALQEHPDRRRFDVTLERKASIIGLVPMPGTYDYIERVIPGPVVPLRTRNLIPAGETTGSSIIYVRETSITNSPFVPIVPGGLKMQGDVTYDIQQKPVVTIPAYMKASLQVWEDLPMFGAWINSRLLYSLSGVEESQLLYGNGTPPNLEGLMQVALTAGTVAGVGGVAVLDNVAAGLSFVYAHGYTPDGIVLNPTDWGKVLTTKTAVAGMYLLGEPSDITQPYTLWGLPVVISLGMKSGDYLVGQFNPYCQLFDREDAAIEVSEQDQDDFVRNLVTVRAEERLSFAVYQPGAFAKGTFTP